MFNMHVRIYGEIFKNPFIQDIFYMYHNVLIICMWFHFPWSWFYFGSSCSGEQCSKWVSCVISLFLINYIYIYAKLVSFITVFSKIGEKCQNYTDGFANVKGMNYFFMSLYAKFIRELQKVCHHFYTYLGKDVEYLSRIWVLIVL